MRIMGLDPGIAHTGYAVIEVQDQELILDDLGIITTSSDASFVKRLTKIGSALEKIIEKYQPSEISIEDIFIAASPRMALKLGHARGVVMYVAGQSQARIYEYTPVQVKSAVVGYGRAGKDQVRKMARTLLHLEKLNVHDDASDALAVAICHYHSSRLRYHVDTALRRDDRLSRDP